MASSDQDKKGNQEQMQEAVQEDDQPKDNGQVVVLKNISTLFPETKWHTAYGSFYTPKRTLPISATLTQDNGFYSIIVHSSQSSEFIFRALMHVKEGSAKLDQVYIRFPSEPTDFLLGAKKYVSSLIDPKTDYSSIEFMNKQLDEKQERNQETGLQLKSYVDGITSAFKECRDFQRRSGSSTEGWNIQLLEDKHQSDKYHVLVTHSDLSWFHLEADVPLSVF